MANNITDPQWVTLLPADIRARVTAVLGIKDGDQDESRWVVYAQLSGPPERCSAVWTPATSGLSYTVSALSAACEGDIQRKGVAARVGLVQQARAVEVG